MTDDIRKLWPDPPQNLAERLQHFVDNWPQVPGSTVVVMATSGVYGIGVMTGLTMDDIRTLAAREVLGPETVAYGSQAEQLGRDLRRRLAAEGRTEGEWGHGPATGQGGPQEGHSGP